MAIDLLHSFRSKGQNITQNNKADTARSIQTPANAQVLRAMHALKAGQTIQGEIISVKGDNVQLAIMKDVILDAKLAQSMNLTAGTNMTFQIKSNSGNNLSLLPLFTNIAADPNAMKALDMAGIPLTERTLEMVKTLMQRGLPIDKQSLQEVYRDLNAFKDAEVGNIISLRQMNIPVTTEHLQQLTLYENNQHFLGDTFTDMGTAIGQQVESWIAEGNVEKAKELIQALKQMFTGENQTEKTVVNENTATSGKTIISEEMFINSQKEGTGKQVEGNQSTESKLSNNQWDELLDMFSKSVSSENAEKNPQKVSSFLKTLWNQSVKEQWLLEPKVLLDKDKVQDFYEKLTKQVKQLETLVESHTSNQSSATKAVQNTASNLEFMQQMNQTYAYIQLPLKLANQQANGELYVYTNKKSMAKQDGKVTALLHLDMQNLGSMDIYVAMENQKVSTQFYLEKEEYLDFLESRMDLLTERLNKRGYDCTVKTSVRTEAQEEPVMKKIENSQNSPMLLSMQAFDMRA